ncbi:MAG: hypothetical protein EAZ89_13360, partial [Bacteroidetes bacterium]
MKSPRLLLTLLLLATTVSLMAQSPFAYEKAWRSIDSLEQKKLTRQGIEESERVRLIADAEKNDPQYIRALVYVLKFQQVIEEKSDSLAVSRLSDEIKRSSFPRKAVLQSMKAELLSQYFSGNNWQISQRTAQETTGEDFQTWDAATFVREISALHLASVSQAADLQKISIDSWAAALVRGDESVRYRPTLYDLLAHRAMDYFANNGNSLPEATDEWKLSAAAGFAPAEQFVQQSLPNNTSRVAQILRMYQQILAFHLSRKDPYALVDADLKRLAYVRGQLGESLTKEAYRTALDKLSLQHLSHPVRADVIYELARLLTEDAQNYDPFDPAKKNADSYRRALGLCEEMINVFPQSRGALNCKALRDNQIKQKNIELSIETVNIPNQPFRTLVEWRNVDKLYFRVIEWDDRTEKLISQFRYGEDGKLVNMLRERKVILAFEQSLPDDGDFHKHRAEVRVPPLPAGKYILLASSDKQFRFSGQGLAYARTQVSQLSWLYKADPREGHHYYLTNRQTGLPVVGAEAQVTLYDRWNQSNASSGGKFKTDADGHIFFNVPEERSFTVQFTDRNDKISTDWVYGGYRYREATKPLPVQQTYFFTDRSIYRPGQTIHFKAILLEKEENAVRILPGQDLTVRFLDVNGQEVGTQTLRTNSYGSVAGTFTAPSGGLTGAMQLVTASGNTSVRVEEYKRPTFEVTADPVKGAYKLLENITVTGSAKAFSGAPIGGAQVKYRVVRQARYPYWYGWWWRPMPTTASREIASGNVASSDEGTFSITFPALPDETVNPEDKPVFTYTLYIDVVDISGETRSTSASVQVGYVSVELEAEIPSQVNKAQPGVFALKGRNLNGEETPVKGKLRIYPLKAPAANLRDRRWARQDRFTLTEAVYKQNFPRDVYTNEDQMENWPQGAAITDQDFDTGISAEVKADFLRNAPAGSYKAEFQTEAGTLVRYFTLYDPAAKVPAVPVWLSGQLDKSKAAPGETVTLTLTTSEPTLSVRYQLSQGEKIFESRRIDLVQGNNQVKIPIIDAYKGDVHIHIVWMSHNQYREDNYSISVPWTEKELKLEWITFRKALQPGQQEQWKLKISGPAAERVAAEMVASLYDASLDAFTPHSFSFYRYPTYWGASGYQTSGYGTTGSDLVSYKWNLSSGYVSTTYDALAWWDYSLFNRWRRNAPMMEMMSAPMSAGAPAPRGSRIAEREKKSRM